MKLSFIVLTYHRGDFLQNCLDSIYSQVDLPRPYEIIVVDNGRDAKITPPADADIHLRIEVPETNLWATGGRNLGMRLTQGDYLIFIDDDAVWAEADAVKRLISHLERDPKRGAIAAKSLKPDGEVIIGELPHPNKTYARNLQTSAEVPYFYTMGMGLRAAVLAETGLYPDRFHIYNEEVDLSLRLIDAGYSIVFDPNINVYHYKADQGRPVTGANYWRHNALNKSRVVWRLLPYPLTTLLVWSAAIVVKTRKPRVVWQVWKSLWQNAIS